MLEVDIRIISKFDFVFVIESDEKTEKPNVYYCSKIRELREHYPNIYGVFLSSYHRQGEKMKVSCHVFET
jgi:hypothetical protein